MKNLCTRVVFSTFLVAASMVGGARPAQACGGFFCSRAQPVNQAAERIIFSDKPLPRLGTGKIDRRALKAQFAH